MQIRINNDLFKRIIRAGIMIMLISNVTANAANNDNFQCVDSRQAWKVLTENKIFFGHQSVGRNIINGLELLAEKCNQKLLIKKYTEVAQLNEPLFMHSSIGKNREPETKINDFSNLINKGVGREADIAFMKFCYIDIQHDTDVNELFTQYREAITRLSNHYPDTKFFVVSAPLTTLKKGIKYWVKNALAGHLSGVSGGLDNKKRHEFNELLRSEYNLKNELFDLADIESTLPDGSREKYTLDEKEYYSLYEGYTSDGGHLNEQGQLRVAQALLLFLGEMDK